MTIRIRRCIGCALLAAILLLLGGCGAVSSFKQNMEASQAEMDDLLVKLMTCVENNDAQGAAALAYDPQEMLAGFSSISDGWPVRGTDPFEHAGLHVTKSNDSDSGHRTVTNATYIIHCQDQDYQAQFSVCEDSGGKGFTGFHVVTVQSLVDNGIQPAGAGAPSAKKSFGQWCFTGFWILSCLFCLASIVEVVLRKPNGWVLWILISLVFFGFNLTTGPTGIQTGIRFGLLNGSEWTRYPNGANHFELCFPVGAILYWILRKRLRKKEQPPVFAVPIDTVQSNAVPVESSPLVKGASDQPQRPEPERTE